MWKKTALALVAVAALSAIAIQPASAARDRSGNCIPPTPNSTGTLPQIPSWFVFIPGPGWVDPNSAQGRQGIAEYQACERQRDVETGRVPAYGQAYRSQGRRSYGNGYNGYNGYGNAYGYGYGNGYGNAYGNGYGYGYGR